MADGLDPNELAQRLKEADPLERRRLIDHYKAWIVEGARAQGGYRFGIILIGASVIVVANALSIGRYEFWLCGLAALLAAPGIWLTRIAFRRERDWRRAHPFRYGDINA